MTVMLEVNRMTSVVIRLSHIREFRVGDKHSSRITVSSRPTNEYVTTELANSYLVELTALITCLFSE